LNCEICGSTIYGSPRRIILEGTRLLVCGRCSGLGEPDLKVEEKQKPSAPRPLGTPKPPASQASRLPKEIEELEITDDFPRMIKKAREKKKMSQEDLARTINERLSIIQKIELGKMTPDLRLTHALEHALRVKLLVPRKEPEMPEESVGHSEITLGDVIQYKKK
jgi:putative transcription factor